MIRLNSLILLPLLSFFWLLGGVLIAGYLYPGYSHLAQYMSELGATGTGNGDWVNLIVFAGAEIWVMLFVVHALRTVSGRPVAGLILLGLYAILLVVAAFVPCDFECRPETPSPSHLIHVSVGFMAYASGLCGLFLISRALPRVSGTMIRPSLAAVLLVTGIALLSGTLLSQDLAGLFQRLLEGLLYVWMVLVGISLSSAHANGGSLEKQNRA